MIAICPSSGLGSEIIADSLSVCNSSLGGFEGCLLASFNLTEHLQLGSTFIF